MVQHLFRKHLPSKEQVFSLLSFFELITSAIFFFVESIDLDGSGFFGLSGKRIFILLILFCLSIFFLVNIGFVRKKNLTFKSFQSIKRNTQSWLFFISIIVVVWGLVSIFFPVEMFGKFKGYFWLQRPLSIPIGMIIFQFWIFVNFPFTGSEIFKSRRILLSTVIPISIIAAIIFAFASFISISKIGLIKDTEFWNVPGIPITGMQLFITLVLTGVIGCLLPILSGKLKSLHYRFLDLFLPLLILIITILVWNGTPMLRHFFSLEQTPPNFQPFPFSDAREHDLGALSILSGNGIYFHGFTDKPLYMVFLAILHFFSGNDYTLLIKLQVSVLALIPVILYFLGKNFHSRLFGVVIATLIIIQQRNAIVLAYKVASVNPKLLVTEELTLLGIILCVFLLFLWMKTEDSRYAIFLGGTIGALSLIRLNPFLLLPMLLLICLFIFMRRRKEMVKQIFLISLSFFIVFTPWIITGVDSNNVPWLFTKISFIINNRINSLINTPQSLILPEDVEENNKYVDYQEAMFVKDRNNSQILSANVLSIQNSVFQRSDVQTSTQKDRFVILFINHFLHNLSTSFLALPDSSVSESLDSLSQREYWNNANQFSEKLPARQITLIIINILLISLGIAYCWRKYRWAGLVPLMVFITYDVAISAAMNSGSRYIVPINWIIYFYYLLGIFEILSMVIRFCYPLHTLSDIPADVKVRKSSDHPQRKILLSFIPLILLASLIPIANVLLPKIIHTPVPYLSEEQVSIITNGNQNEVQLKIGEILYPHNSQEDGTMSFGFLENAVISNFRIESNYLIEPDIYPENEQVVVLCFNASEDEPDLVKIYRMVDQSPELFWEKNELN